MVTATRSIWARWFWRDFRANWLAIVVVALVIAIGTGVFAGLSSTGRWRRASNDASFAAQDMHDLRVSLAPGTFAAIGDLTRVASGIPSASALSGSSERLIVGTQLDASTPDEAILVGGRIVGLDPQNGPDRLWVDQGKSPRDRSAVLEVKFANTFNLPMTGEVLLAGGETLEYVGLGTLPTDFYVSGERGDLLAQFNFAVLYTTLERAQELAGRPDAVNDLVLTLRAGADRDRIQAELERALSVETGFSAIVTTTDDDEAFRILYDDIDSDQRLWSVLSIIVLGSAALAAFNLVSRLVDAQRREIGVGMAIGVPTRFLIVRPLLVGVEIAMLGVVLGVVVGQVIGVAMRALLVDLVPLPVWLTSFQPAIYARAAALGVAVPLVSAVVPIWRAVRVEPIDAIRTSHLSGKRPPRLLRRIRLPGSSLNQMPLRNVLRTPQRTALTSLGVAAAITALVAVLGMLDSFSRTVEQADEEVTQGTDGRITTTLDGFYSADREPLISIAALPGVAQVDQGVQLPASVSPPAGGGEALDVLIESVDFSSAAWTPSGTDGANLGPDELVLAEDAAADLGVNVGDMVSVRHPIRSETGFGIGHSVMMVAGVHPNPLRVFAYVGPEATASWGFGDLVNVAQVIPERDASPAQIQATLFETDGVSSAHLASRMSEVFEDAIDQFTGILLITQGAVVALACLIAFNSARITVEERRHEHATMLAFGTPIRSVLATIVEEGVFIGALATGIGLLGGLLTLSWIVNQLLADTLPELGVVVDIRPMTIVIAAAIGIVAAALTPVLMVRRLRSMNLPSTLRVVE